MLTVSVEGRVLISVALGSVRVETALLAAPTEAEFRAVLARAGQPG